MQNHNQRNGGGLSPLDEAYEAGVRVNRQLRARLVEGEGRNVLGWSVNIENQPIQLQEAYELLDKLLLDIGLDPDKIRRVIVRFVDHNNSHIRDSQDMSYHENISILGDPDYNVDLVEIHNPDTGQSVCIYDSLNSGERFLKVSDQSLQELRSSLSYPDFWDSGVVYNMPVLEFLQYYRVSST